jgi:hypothetical protein
MILSAQEMRWPFVAASVEKSKRLGVAWVGPKKRDRLAEVDNSCRGNSDQRANFIERFRDLASGHDFTPDSTV